jgi:hypothetical protein
VINKYSELSLEELLNLLPPCLELPIFEGSHPHKPGNFDLVIRKLDKSSEGFMVEGDDVMKALGNEGAWSVGYLYVDFRIELHPCRLLNHLDLLSIEESEKLGDDDIVAGGILSADLKDAIIKLINWLNENNICQV